MRISRAYGGVATETTGGATKPATNAKGYVCVGDGTRADKMIAFGDNFFLTKDEISSRYISIQFFLLK